MGYEAYDDQDRRREVNSKNDNNYNSKQKEEELLREVIWTGDIAAETSLPWKRRTALPSAGALCCSEAPSLQNSYPSLLAQKQQQFKVSPVEKQKGQKILSLRSRSSV